MSDKRIDMSMEQFDDALKAWESKGKAKSLKAAVVASIPLVLFGSWFASDIDPGLMLSFCVTYYCCVAALVIYL